MSVLVCFTLHCPLRLSFESFSLSVPSFSSSTFLVEFNPFFYFQFLHSLVMVHCYNSWDWNPVQKWFISPPQPLFLSDPLFLFFDLSFLIFHCLLLACHPPSALYQIHNTRYTILYSLSVVDCDKRWKGQLPVICLNKPHPARFIWLEVLQWHYKSETVFTLFLSSRGFDKGLTLPSLLSPNLFKTSQRIASEDATESVHSQGCGCLVLPVCWLAHKTKEGGVWEERA